jgi:hypothetical protein
LYNRWINTYKTGAVDVDRTRLEAKCFLQMEDLVGIFKKFDGKGALTNRNEAESFLSMTGCSWVLRHSSIQDTEYNKAYALTYKNNKGFIHIAIIHKIGEGFFYNADFLRKSISKELFNYSRSYPTIVCLLEAEIPDMLRETANF